MTETKYPVFQNKALDYNKLLESQANGKLLKKVLKFPLIAMIKYDGHYCTIDVKDGKPIFTTSGGVRYTHRIDLWFLPDGTYIAERIAGNGKLGESRRGVALEGSVGSKFAKQSNTYIIHNKISAKPYKQILQTLHETIDNKFLPEFRHIQSKAELDTYMKEVTRDGWEGLMLINPDYVFKNTKSRNIDFCKYKKRPTADLLCIGAEPGEGKYEGMIGSLVMKDFSGRVVSTGSGMSDEDRRRDRGYFIGKVLEIEYEQIANTYIQPTFGCSTVGVTIRTDKTKEEID